LCFIDGEKEKRERGWEERMIKKEKTEGRIGKSENNREKKEKLHL